MGLKFRRFRAKLNWKTKETVPEVVCLRYKIHSEFDEVPVATTSTTQVETNNVVKQKKPVPKPPVQNVFEGSNSKPEIKVNQTPVAQNKETKNGVLTQTNGKTTPTTVASKGILKKSSRTEEIAPEAVIASSIKSRSDSTEKSALIFMTEDHDYKEEPEEVSKREETNEELYLDMNSFSDMNDNYEPHNSVPAKLEQTSSEVAKGPRSSESESEREDEVKTVRWRETIIEINPPCLSEPTSNDFKVHFVKHQDISKSNEETDESEPEDDQPQKYSHYGSRSAYSSQAASIFFAGEEPEPAERVRNISQQDGEEDDDIPHESHTKA